MSSRVQSFAHQVSHHFNRGLHFLRTKDARQVFKSVLAYMLASLLLFYPDFSVSLLWSLPATDVRALLVYAPLAVLLIHPSMSVGGMLRQVFYFSIAAGITALVHLWWMPILVQAHAAISLLFIAVFSFLVALVRAYRNKTMGTACSTATLILVAHIGYMSSSGDPSNSDPGGAVGAFTSASINATNILATGWQPMRTVTLLVILLLGASLSVTVCCLCFPVLAQDTVRRHIKASLRQLGELLSLLHLICTEQQHEPKLMQDWQSAVIASRSAFKQLTAALDEAHLEQIGCFPVSHDALTVTLRRLLRHLTSMDRSIALIVQNQNTARSLSPLLQELAPSLTQMVTSAMLTLRDIYQTFQIKKAFSPLQRRDSVEAAWSQSRRETLQSRTRQFQAHYVPMQSGLGGAATATATVTRRTSVLENLQKRLSGYFEQQAKESQKQKWERLVSRFPLIRLKKQEPLSQITPPVLPSSSSNEHLTTKQTTNEHTNDTILDLSPIEDEPALPHEETSILIPLDEAVTLFKAEQERLLQKHLTTTSQWPLDTIFAMYGLLLCFNMFGDQLNVMAQRCQVHSQSHTSIHDDIDPTRLDEQMRSRKMNPFSLVQANYLAQELKGAFRVGDAPFSFTIQWMKKFLHWLQSSQVKYALRVALVVTFSCMFGFIDDTRGLFTAWRGQWAVLTVAVTMTTTLGESSLVCFYRVLGTIAGGVYAALVWQIINANNDNNTLSLWHLLACILFAWPSFYIRLFTKYTRLGLVSLITFNVVFYGHAAAVNSNVWILAMQRCLLIALGVILSLLGTLCLFPMYARTAMRLYLATILHELSLLQAKCFTALYLNPAERQSMLQSTILPLEFQVQEMLVTCSELLVHCPAEPRLSPFPSASYKELMDGCQSILDLQLSQRIAIFQGFSNDFVMQVLLPLHPERRALLSVVMMHMTLLLGSLYGKSPLPPEMPDTLTAKSKLDVAFQRLDPQFIMLQSHNFHYLHVSSCYTTLLRQLTRLSEILSVLFGSRAMLLKELDLTAEQWKRTSDT